jgi:multidrug efflux pump
VRAKLAGLPGVRAFPVMRQGFGASIQKPLQFVIGGGTYPELAQWRDTLLEQIEGRQPGPDRNRLGLQGNQTPTAGEHRL